jgi:hypothetical protein
MIQAVYDDVIDFIFSRRTPEEVIAFHASEETQSKVDELIHRQKTTGLSPEEALELEDYLQLEHLMRLAKARALERLARHANGESVPGSRK